MNDTELLKAFVERRDAEAFRLIVERYASIVHSAACRQVGAGRGGHLADDVAQAVFIMLSQRAHRVRNGAVLAGWLVKATRLAAKAAARSERRLKIREQKASTMNLPTAQEWQPDESPEAAALLDEALSRLRPRDRTALTLRYLRGLPMLEVAATMGVSEQAAARRVTRAVGRLRRHFAWRGVAVSGAVVVATVAGSVKAGNMPAGFIERVATTSLAAPGALPVAGAAALLAKGAIVSMNVKTIFAVATVLVVLVMCGSVLLLSSGTHHEPVAAPPAAEAPAPVRTIRVGLLISKQTAAAHLQGPGSDGMPGTNTAQTPPWGYSHMTTITQELQHPTLELIPVIEAGTENDPELATILRRQFTSPAIHGEDARALGKLDLLVAAQVWYTTPGIIAAINEAVNDGMGLIIRQALGDWTPGYTPGVLRLHGLKEAAYGQSWPWNKAISCEVVGEHPILGNLSGKKGMEMTDFLAVGAFGALTEDVVPLVRVKNIAQVNPGGAHPEWAFYSLYTARLGRGRIVCCNFDVHNQPGLDLQMATDGNFTLRCVEWLAREHAAAATQPVTTLPAEVLPEALPSFRILR